MTHEKVIEMINEYLEEPHSIDKEWVEALIVCRDAINDVVKAFKKCTSEHLGCEDDCPCMSVINRQKKEIDILIRKKDNLRDEIAESQAEIERLNAVSEICGECHKQYAEKIEQAKSEAIKEFAERLKEVYSYHPMLTPSDFKAVAVRDINNLVKELTEKNDFNRRKIK